MTAHKLTFRPTIPPNVEVAIVMRRVPAASAGAVESVAAAVPVTSAGTWGRGWAPSAYLANSGVGTFANGNRHWQFLAPRPFLGGVVELVGLVSRTSGKAYFEIGCPSACKALNIGLALFPQVAGTSAYDLSEYRLIYFSDGGGGGVDTESDNPTFNCPFLGQFRVAGDVYGFAVDCDSGKIDTIYFNGVAMPMNDPDFATANTWPGGTEIKPRVNARDKSLRDSTCGTGITFGDTDDDEGCSFRLNTSGLDFRYPVPEGYEAWDPAGGGVADPVIPKPGDYADPTYGGALDATVTAVAGVAWFALSARQDSNRVVNLASDGGDIGIYNKNGVCWKSGASLTANNEPGRDMLIAVGSTFGHDFAATGAVSSATITLT